MICAALNRDTGCESPLDWTDNVGLFTAGRDSPLSVRDLTGYCNSNFDADRVRSMTGIVDLAGYVESCGGITVRVGGGFLVMGHDQIVAEFGYDNPKSRSAARGFVEHLAELYGHWLDGDCWAVTVYDDVRIAKDVTDGNGIATHYLPPQDAVIEDVGGFYGYDSAYDEALNMIDRCSASQSRKAVPKRSVSKASKPKSKAPVKKSASKPKSKGAGR